MKRLILMLAAVFTFSTALVSCRDTETRVDDEVEIETDDDGIEVDDGTL